MADANATKKPAFDAKDVSVIFVLGGPGAGKGTQCTKLVQEFGCWHLSAGDLLRAEQDRPGSEFGDLIRSYIKDGKIVPMEITVRLLEHAMRDALENSKEFRGSSGYGVFLIDGFPRKLDQAQMFEEDVCVPTLVLNFKTTEETMLTRLLERGKTSGRADDNVESIKKRFRTFHEDTEPVIRHYEELSKVAEIDSSEDVEVVYKKTSAQMREILTKKAKQTQ